MAREPRAEPAPLPVRWAAALVDLALLWAVGDLVALTVLQIAGSWMGPAATLWAAGVAVLGTWAVYFAVGEGRWGYTLGKLALGVRVLGENGRPVGWRRALLRFLARLAGTVVLGLGWWPALGAGGGAPARRAWHDRVAGTAVYRLRPWQGEGLPGGPSGAAG